MYYMIDNPNPFNQQYRAGRRGKLSGGVLLHTTESPKERGAQPIAHWIATQRKDYGSYHVIVDNKQAIIMAPDHYETWHCAAPGFNQSTWGISIACRSSELNPDDQWTRDAITQMGKQIRAFWDRHNFKPEGFKNPQTLLTSPGLTNHGDAQPWDRSDAFATHPRRKELEKLLVEAINQGEKEMTPPVMIETGGRIEIYYRHQEQIIHEHPNGSLWLLYPGTPYRVEVRKADLPTFKYLGVPVQKVDQQTADFFWTYNLRQKPPRIHVRTPQDVQKYRFMGIELIKVADGTFFQRYSELVQPLTK
jgi:hypothetical protein